MATPKALRVSVWNTYIGEKTGQAQCWVGCGSTITQSNFECGHIQSRYHGGETTIDNLRPVCSSCNKSIGIKNMNEFKKEYGFKTPIYPKDDVLIEVELEKETKNDNLQNLEKKLNSLVVLKENLRKLNVPDSRQDLLKCTISNMKEELDKLSYDELKEICELNSIKKNITKENMKDCIYNLRFNKELDKSMFLIVEQDKIEEHNTSLKLLKEHWKKVLIILLIVIIIFVIFIVILPLA